MKKIYLLFLLITYSNTFAQVSGAGIGTSNPQQALHLAGATGTVRVESLNATNNIYNGGVGKTSPLFVDNNGDLTLQFVPLYNSEASDALDHASLPGAVVTLLAGDADGLQVGELFNFNITTNRASILEVKYNVSMAVFLTPAEAKINDLHSRRINTYFQVNGAGRKYGHAAKCYTGGTTDGVAESLFNTSTTYINLPAAATYTIRFYGEVSSSLEGTNAGGGTLIPNTGLATCVKFARGRDTLLFRLH